MPLSRFHDSTGRGRVVIKNMPSSDENLSQSFVNKFVEVGALRDDIYRRI